MAKKITKNKKIYYVCDECNFAYKNKEIAEKCENWCRKHHSCNTEITKYAVEV